MIITGTVLAVLGAAIAAFVAGKVPPNCINPQVLGDRDAPDLDRRHR